MEWIDWTVVAVFMVSMVLVGVFFSHKAGKNVDSFFVSGRTLTWYVAGASMIATSFAADTPLWVGSLVRQYGVHAVWQYWAPLIGSALGVVLFARLWRRTKVVTDVELTELRYSGKSAGALRGITGGVGALVICPLIIGWVAKAMVTISQEALGLGGYQLDFLGISMSSETLATFVVMGCALLLCAFSGLYGVVYTDFIQFIIATGGAFLLAWLSVMHVGGLSSMIEQLSAKEEWLGHSMNLAPEISMQVRAGGQTGTMSIWNVIGYFGILWWAVALSGGYQAQRILACKNTRHASNALLMHTIVYYAIVSLPWVVVALASLLIFPDLGEAGHDAAYPRMILHILPVGLRGIMISAMIAAFISTMSTLFNWGSSYIVNDLYRRFLHRGATDKHYVRVSRIITFMVAIGGGIISVYADNIQQLLSIFYVVGGGAAVVGACRWLWWRINAPGELAAFVMNYLVAIIMLFGHIPFASPDGYDVNLMAVETREDLPEEGEAQVIVARTDEGIHVRIFDAKGSMDVDKPEAELPVGEELTDLKEVLNTTPFPGGAALSEEEKETIIVKAASITEHILAEPIMDPLMGSLLGFEKGVSFTSDYDTLGARMLFMTIMGLIVVVGASLLTPATDNERLKEFVMRTRIFEPGWRKVTRQIPGYVSAHKVGDVLVDWALVIATVCSLLFALNNVVRYKPMVSVGLFALFVVLLVIVLRRTRRECPVDDAMTEEEVESAS